MPDFHGIQMCPTVINVITMNLNRACIYIVNGDPQNLV